MATEADQQREVIAFLAAPATHGVDPGQVTRRDTHGAYVFLAGAIAWKIKRSVRFAYLDFSDLEKRRRALVRELEINRSTAPDIYLDLVPVTRSGSGDLQLGGDGPVVEWALKMRRFDEADLLGARVRQDRLDADLLKLLADAVAASHRMAPMRAGTGADAGFTGIVEHLCHSLADLTPTLPAGRVEAFCTRATDRLSKVGSLLERRGREGFVRRCHGDLHLDNIVVWKGRPTLFDALEFDEQLATIDTLYDLAFLLMDLIHNGRRDAANFVLNRYLWRTAADLDLEGLAALPLFTAARSGIRALVRAQHARQMRAAGDDAGAERETAAAGSYLEGALAALDLPPARLVAVGGLSGTGKSTLAASLAPGLGARTGAVHLRSDLERKAMLGVEETDRLGQHHYTPEIAVEVYERLARKAGLALAAGQTVVVDAVFSAPKQRERLEAVAARANVPFAGLWLTAAPEILIARVTARRGDASDADAAVVRRQLAKAHEVAGWSSIDASGTPLETLDRARHALALVLGDAPEDLRP